MKPKTLRPKSRSALPQDIRLILVPVDFSQPSEDALKYAAGLAGVFGVKLILLNVIEPFPTPDFAASPMALDDKVIVAQAKERMTKMLTKTGVNSQSVEKIVVGHGSPYAEITSAARTFKAGLIVISTHGYTGLAHLFMGSTAERVVRHASCPVLVVRANGADLIK